MPKGIVVKKGMTGNFDCSVIIVDKKRQAELSYELDQLEAVEEPVLVNGEEMKSDDEFAIFSSPASIDEIEETIEN